MRNIFEKHQVIAVDCDDVISETIFYFLEYFDLKNIFGEIIKLTDIKNYNFSQNKNFGRTNDEFVQMFVEMFEKDVSSYKIPPVKGALEVLKKLKKDGKKLYVVTARQSFLEEYTRNWIKEYFPNIFEDVYFCNHEGGGIYLEKSDICKQIGATLLIDDSVGNIESCLAQGVDTILFTKPWNNEVDVKNDTILRVNGWKELLD